MTGLTAHAAWVLGIAFTLSIGYEWYRATAKAGVSRHDSKRAFVLQLPLYLAAAAVIVALAAAPGWAGWLGLAFSVVMILVSILYYNPAIMLERKPELIDWVEDLVFTGLLFVAATMLAYEVAGVAT